MDARLRKVVSCSMLLGLFILSSNVVAAESRQWLFDVRYSIAGIMQTIPARLQNQCLPAAAPVPDISKPGYQCKSRNYSWFGKKLIWQVDCSNGWESIQGTGRVNFDNEQAAGDVHLQIINPNSLPEYMVVDIQGKPLGACKK